MDRDSAERTLDYINSECKDKVEKAIKDTLGVDTCLVFEIREYVDCYINGRDALADVYQQMTATPLLRQLFRMAWLRIQVWDVDTEIVFDIAVEYEHNFNGGSNGHDLMVVGVNKETGEVTIRK